MHFEELRRADKLVTLGELTAEMAHEINNPAGIILSRTDYLQMIPAMHKYKNDLEVIINQVSKISHITKNILQYSRKRSQSFQKIDLVSILNACINFLEPRFLKKNIQLSRKFDEINSQVTGDPLQMEQAFVNLINNAIDALSQNGHLDIHLKRNDDNKLQIMIRDDGIGMDEDTRERIFSPFFTTKNPDQGTGLGLYIVKNICKNHGAEIRCSSSTGKGSTFIITFEQE